MFTCAGKTSTPNHRVWIWLLSLLAAWSVNIQTSRAQQRPMLLVDFGYQRELSPARYNPVRVQIGWIGDAVPGQTVSARPARLELRYGLDDAYEAQLSTPITIEPGKLTEKTLYLWSRNDLTNLEVELRDERGRLLADFEVNSTTVPTVNPAPRILQVGRERPVWSRLTGAQTLLMQSALVQTPVSKFPRTWSGLDGVNLIIITQLDEERFDGAQLRTLVEWVARGGELVIVAADSLDAYRTIVEETFGVVLQPGEYNAVPRSDDLDEQISDRLLKNHALLIQNNPNQTIEPADPQSTPDFLFRRELRVSHASAEEGWKVHSLQRRSIDETTDQGELVAGPYGHGRLTIVGTDPGALTTWAGPDASLAGWMYVFSKVASPILTDMEQARTSAAAFGSVNDIPTTTRLAMRNAILDWLSTRVLVRSELFPTLTMSLFFLVLLIGPIDYFLLRRLRKEPWTWFTVVLYVALTCAALAGLQRGVAVAPMQVARISTVDVIPASPRSPVSGYTSIASPRSSRYTVRSLAEEARVQPVGWNAIHWYRSDQNYQRTIGLAQTGEDRALVPMRIGMGGIAWIHDEGLIPTPKLSATIVHSPAQNAATLELLTGDDIDMASASSLIVNWRGQVWTSVRPGPWTSRESNGRIRIALRPMPPEQHQLEPLVRQHPISTDWRSVETLHWHDVIFGTAMHEATSRRLKSVAADQPVVYLLFNENRLDVTIERQDSVMDVTPDLHHRVYRLPAHVTVNATPREHEN